MTDDEFDRALDEFAAAVVTVLRDKSYKIFPSIAQLVFPDRAEIKSLVSREGDVDAAEFGRAIGGPLPDAVFVAMDDADQVRISGGTADGRRNAAEIRLERTRWRKILRPMQVVRHYCREATSAGGGSPAEDLLQGLRDRSG